MDEDGRSSDSALLSGMRPCCSVSISDSSIECSRVSLPVGEEVMIVVEYTVLRGDSDSMGVTVIIVVELTVDCCGAMVTTVVLLGVSEDVV